MSETAPHVAAPVTSQPDEPYASWGLRVAASLVDAGIQLPFVVFNLITASVATDPDSGPVTQILMLVLGLVSAVASLVFSIWNLYVRQGRCGASLGKQCFGLLLISGVDARPIGGVSVFVRSLMHALDALPLGLGYLWPLVDRRRQTFADKVMNTVVLRLPDVRF
ncbi:MAG: RDD family protein [Marmoricola sp.]